MSEVAERLAANVVTSENLAEFNAKRMGLADPLPSEAVEKAEPQDVEQGQSEPTEVENEATATEDKKQNPKLERRFSEITKQREAAREEAALLAELAGQGALAAQLRAMRPLPDKHEKQS
jgi:hypothetical protein